MIALRLVNLERIQNTFGTASPKMAHIEKL